MWKYFKSAGNIATAPVQRVEVLFVNIHFTALDITIINSQTKREEVLYKGIVVVKVDPRARTRVERRHLRRDVDVIYLVYNPKDGQRTIRSLLFDFIEQIPTLVQEGILRKDHKRKLNKYERVLGMGLGRRMVRNFAAIEDRWLSLKKGKKTRGVHSGFDYMLHRDLLESQAYATGRGILRSSDENLLKIAGDVLTFEFTDKIELLYEQLGRNADLIKKINERLAARQRQIDEINEKLTIAEDQEEIDELNQELTEVQIKKDELDVKLDEARQQREQLKEQLAQARSDYRRLYDEFLAADHEDVANELLKKVKQYFNYSTRRFYRRVLGLIGVYKENDWKRLATPGRKSRVRRRSTRDRRRYDEAITESLDTGTIDSKDVLGRGLNLGIAGDLFGNGILDEMARLGLAMILELDEELSVFRAELAGLADQESEQAQQLQSEIERVEARIRNIREHGLSSSSAESNSDSEERHSAAAVKKLIERTSKGYLMQPEDSHRKTRDTEKRLDVIIDLSDAN